MSTVGVTHNLVSEFLEVAINNILHARKLYPDSIFERKRKYGVIVYQSIHPDVNDYILECVKAINFHLKRNQLKAVHLCFISSGKIIEKYYFEIINLNNNFNSDVFLVKLEQFLRDYCLKQHSSENHLDELPSDASFTIQLCCSEYSNVEFNQEPSNEDFPWVGVKQIDNTVIDSEIIPLHTIESECLTLQTYIEKPSSDHFY